MYGTIFFARIAIILLLIHIGFISLLMFAVSTIGDLIITFIFCIGTSVTFLGICSWVFPDCTTSPNRTLYKNCFIVTCDVIISALILSEKLGAFSFNFIAFYAIVIALDVCMLLEIWVLIVLAVHQYKSNIEQSTMTVQV
jgi:hypothetical protein